MSFKSSLRKKFQSIIGLPPTLEKEELHAYIRPFIEEAEAFLSLLDQHGSPLYILDEPAFRNRSKRFTDAFGRYFSDFKAYLAVKCNHHPTLADAAVESGLGLDVSSGVELEMGLSRGCTDILFSGPGKTDAELALAAEHQDKITVLIDSFAELGRLESTARQKKCSIRCGVRLCTEEKGLWRKFGISLSALEAFLTTAAKYPHIDIAGLQFHTSWNRHPDRQTAFIRRLGETLSGFTPSLLSLIRFIDIGGGYWPSRGEWLHFAGTAQGRLFQSLPLSARSLQAHYKLDAAGIDTFAQKISEAMKAHIFPLVPVAVKAEPGRWLCDDAMHLLLTVIDKKADDLVVADGGMNTVGWERFETDYAPIINLSRPSNVERKCQIFGSLCTPHDIWGYTYFGQGIEPGDALLIPGQGAYTYSLRQNFIKPLPRVVKLCQ
jgi:diaminopimelate decarboxylase